MSRKVVSIIQHAACEPPGLIADVLEARDIGVRIVRPFEGEPVPRCVDRYDGFVLMGGPMGVGDQDRYSFLKDELALLRDAVLAEKPVLGVCLGSQLLAAALGARVARGPRKEIGWFPVTLTPAAAQSDSWRSVPPRFTALHWHGDSFALPDGCVPLASSELTPHQAFAYGPAVLGVLFHLETTWTLVAGMVANFTDELRDAEVDGRQILAQASRFLPELDTIGRTVFGGWASVVSRASSGKDAKP
jgi:GMP synthase (glutamine-hydrolysing)